MKNLKIPPKQGCADVTKAWRKSKPKKPPVSSPKADRLQSQPYVTDVNSDANNDATNLEERSSDWQEVRRRTRRHSGANRNRLHVQMNHRSGERNQHYDRTSYRYTKMHNENQRCQYCAEHNHSTRDCGFRKPALCRQCGAHGHKQKFCVDFSSR